MSVFLIIGLVVFCLIAICGVVFLLLGILPSKRRVERDES